MKQINTEKQVSDIKKESWLSDTVKDLKRNQTVYLMVLPVVAFYIIFHYMPMYGAIIAFKDYSPRLGILGSPWVGMKHIESFLTGPYFWRVLKNTFVISINNLVWGFPAPILLALLINELKSKSFARIAQTITYLPHFVSLVVICGMIKNFTVDSGFINQIIAFCGGTKVTMLNEPSYFVPIYVISGIWQEIGWGSIIYLSAIASISQELYEAATIDGAGRFRQVLNVTIPGILPTIIILLILRIGKLLNVGHEKILLLYNEATRETADVISTFVYRRGLASEGGGNQWSYSTAVGLFNSVVNFILIICTNKISKKTSETSLW